MTYKTKLSYILYIVFLIFLFTACGAPKAETPTPTVAPPMHTSLPPTDAPVSSTPTEVPKKGQEVDVGGYKLYILCQGEGTPTVVLDSGLSRDKSTWDQVRRQNPNDLGIMVCVYDRAGRGLSEASPDKPRTNLDMVNDLHTLLTNAEIPGPYIIVGHSMSGFTARLFADQYPDETVGIVLVDSVCVDESTRVLAVLPPESAFEKNAIRGIRNWNKNLIDDPMKNVEFWDYPTSADQVREIKTHGNLPMVILTHDVINKEMQKILIDTAFGPGLPDDLHEKIEEDWLLQQEELTTLSTNSKHVIVEGSSHMIQMTKPEAVVDAIQWVLEQIRGE